MKRKIIGMLSVLIFSALVVSGCAQSGETNQSAEKEADTTQQSDTGNKRQTEEQEDQQQKNDSNGSDKSENTNEIAQSEINIYQSNADATGFVCEKVSMNEITVDNIENALIDKGVLTNTCKVDNLEIEDIDGRQCINLDFNKEFDTFINGKGSTGEYYTIGSIVNTFLDAYNCEQIKITVEGNLLETGHTDYPGYMNRFE